MERFEPRTTLREIDRAETRDYIYDMIGQLAQLARQSGEAQLAIYLEAIVTARLATAESRVAS